MKKILIVIFILVFAISCGIGKEGSTLSPKPKDAFICLNIVGGNDLDLVSSVKVRTYQKLHAGAVIEDTNFNARYSDTLNSFPSYIYEVPAFLGYEAILTIIPSEAHNIKSVIFNRENYDLKKRNQITFNAGGLVFRGLEPRDTRYVDLITVEFELKDEYLEEPQIVGNEYQVSTSKQLRWIARESARGENFKDKTVKLMNDIDMENKDFVGIACNKNYVFDGILDGNNKEVKNLRIEQERKFNDFSGFVRMLSKDGVVKNLTVSGLISALYRDIGGIVGVNHGTIENCINNASVEGNERVGGIAAYNYGTIKNVKNTGTITGREDRKDGVGQIVGISLEGGVIENATESGSVVIR